MQSLRTLFGSIRSYGSVLLASSTEPQADLLALVWGPRFDREHGRQLAQSVVQNRLAVDHALAQAADTFDQLSAQRQQRLRQLLRHRAGGTIQA